MSSKSSSRYILMTLSLSLFCAMLGVGVISPILPVYASRLGAGGIVLGMVFSAFSFSRIGGMFFSGPLADRVDRKILISIGLLSYTLASLAYLKADAACHLILIRFCHGLGSSLVVPVVMAVGADVADPGREGHFFGTLQMALFMGVGTGPLLSGFLTDSFGWNAPFLTMAGLTSMALVMALTLLPSDPKREGLLRGRTVVPFRTMFGDGLMRRIFFFQFCTALGRGSMLMMIPLLAASMDLSFLQTGIMLSATSLTTALFQRLFGRLGDRFPRTRMVMIGGILSAMVLVPLSLSRSFPVLLIGCICYGLGTAVGSPSILALSAQCGKVYGAGTAMSFTNISFGLGMMSGPLLSGALQDLHLMRTPFPLLGIFLFLAAISFRNGLYLEEKSPSSSRGGDKCGESCD